MQEQHRPLTQCNLHDTAVNRCRTPHRSRHKAVARLQPGSAAAAAAAAATASQPALLYDFHDQLVSYEQAWSWQKQRLAQLCSADTQDRRDTVFLLQHPPVFTLGAGSSEAHVKFDLQQPPHPLYRTERGGEVTYHGPGQLVMYPVLDLTRHTPDLHWYLRGLEEVIIRALAETSGLTGERIPGLTGVWVGGAKLAAIGVRARKWVTYHGLAVNVSTQLQPFRLITPCGIADRPVGSVKSALAAAAAAAAGEGQNRHGPDDGNGGSRAATSSSNGSGSGDTENELFAVAADPLIVEYRYALLAALSDVFGLELQAATDQELSQLTQHTVAGSSSSGGSVGTGTVLPAGVVAGSSSSSG